ncbi:double-strand-break repair protein rad21-like protein 1 [Eublepharis macularius]|uniref:Double-strand-break repair protein rad21-like protein 1 n=1 Tax=Eublepharis macularius TaxID=481883 RepID=A0AA97JDU6_EUBMA|nr:double-strand-break repair protein rad21-like protein 1 [Eublepharis macularius]
MFYAQLLMNKRGPLSKIWLAAHWDKKVTKAHIFECNLEKTVEKILSPNFIIALRTSGHLLLGVVRIYHRKAKYLLSDCTEALLKMQLSFRPGLVDLPKGSSEAKYDTITLPEEFHEFDTQLPEVNAIDVAQHFTLNQSRAEDITLLEEDYRRDILFQGDSLGEETEIPRQHSDSLQASFCGLLTDHDSLNLTGDKTALDESAYSLIHDGFGDEGFAGDMIDDVLGSENALIIDMEEKIPVPEELPDDGQVDYPGSKQEAKSRQMIETILLPSEEQGFILEPIDNTVLKRKQSTKRKLIVDAVKELSKSTIQKQLDNYKDTMTTLDIAPPTRRLMILQELGSVDKLFNRPTQPLMNEDLQQLFAKSLRNGRKRMQQKHQAQGKNQEQGLQELPVIESQSHSALQSELLDEDEKDNSKTAETMETVDVLSALLDGSLVDSSGREQEGEKEQMEVENLPMLHGIFLPLTLITGLEELHESSLDCEEKRRNKRTLALLNTFRLSNQTGAKSVSFLTLCIDKNHEEVATMFYSLLVLKKQLAVEVAQAAPYADIIVTAGPKFHAT